MVYLDPRPRWRAIRINEWLASRLMAAAILLGILMIGAVFGAGALGVLPVETVGRLLLITGGATALCAWLFFYAVTFRPHLAPPALAPDIINTTTSANLADAAEYPLLTLLGKSFHYGAPEELGVLFDRLCQQRMVRDMLARLEIDDKRLRQAVHMQVLSAFSWTELAKNIRGVMAASGRAHVSVLDGFIAYLLDPRLRTWLRQQSLREEDVSFVTWWQHARQDFKKSKRRWWDADNLLDFSGIGLSWAAGFTPFVDRFARPPSGSAWDVGASHSEQVAILMNSLARRRQSNVLLVGQPGVGRIGVVKELMRRVATGKAHPALNDERVLYVHISQLVGLGSTPAAQLTIVSRALDEMERAGNVIAVLDGLGSIVGGGEGRLDLGDVLVPFFSSPTVRVVVIMSTDDYHKRIAGNQELEHLFEVVEVPPLSEEATLQLLALSIEEYEMSADVFVPYRALQEIVEATSSILPHIPFPEKAFDVLEELVVQAQGSDKHLLTAHDVDALIARKTGVTVGQLNADESKRLLSLPDYIHRRVVNQEQGVQAVAHAMVRARAGVRSEHRPIGSFLFLGPTGVGKTETAKALAEVYFGSDEYMQRLDMSEFQGGDAIDRLIGTVEAPVGRLPALNMSHPFCVLLLDEFEKASRTVQELFLPLLDEGYITDAHGRRYSFVHTLLIATSNAGAELIRSHVGSDGKLPDGFEQQLREHILSQGVFLPELLNRFDGVITFAPLTAAHIQQVARLMLVELNKRLDSKHGITVRVTDELVAFLSSAGYDPQFGARPMRRLIQDTVEYWAAQQIVAGTVEPGQEIVLPVPLVPTGYSASETSSTRVPSST